MGVHAECFVECGGSRVALPDVQGYVVAAFLQGKCFDILKQFASDVFAAGVLIHADIINIQRGERHQASALLMLQRAEGIPQNCSVFLIYENGSIGVGKYLQEFIVSVFFSFGLKQVRTSVMMHRQYLSEQTVDSLQIIINSSAYHNVFCLEFKVQAGALDGVGADFGIGHSYVCGVLGVGFERLLALKCAVQHDIGV